MKRLYKGVLKFQKSYFKRNEDLFKRLSESQTPDVLFITCSDSRIDPNLITQSKPGELFIVRNVGNIIPPYDAIKDKNSVAAAIEFAVLGLKITDIIVCGHSNCGAMQALYRDDGRFENMPHLRAWLSIALPLKDLVKNSYPDLSQSGDSFQKIVEEVNIILQLKNIQTYPFVDKLLKEGGLHLHGWHYDIRTGNVYSYKPDSNTFEKI